MQLALQKWYFPKRCLLPSSTPLTATLTSPLTLTFILTLPSLPAGGTTAGGIDAMAPSSREDFTQFEGAISKKILQFQVCMYVAAESTLLCDGRT